MTPAKIYSLTWAEFGSCLSTTAKNLREDSDLLDVTVSAGGRIFSAHKLVLSAASPLLMELLKSARCQHPILMLAGISAIDFEAILEFIYQGEVNIESDHLPSLLQAAQYLDIQALSPSALSSSSTHKEETSKHVEKIINVYSRKEETKGKIPNYFNDEEITNSKKNTVVVEPCKKLCNKRLLRSSTKGRKKLNLHPNSNEIVENIVELTTKEDETNKKENTFNTFFNELFDSSFDNPINNNSDTEETNNSKENMYTNLSSEIRLDVSNNNTKNDCGLSFQNLHNLNIGNKKRSCCKTKNASYYPYKVLDDTDSSSDDLISTEKESTTFLNESCNRRQRVESTRNDIRITKKSFQASKKLSDEKECVPEVNNSIQNGSQSCSCLIQNLHKKRAKECQMANLFPDDDSPTTEDLTHCYLINGIEKDETNREINSAELYDPRFRFQRSDKNDTAAAIFEEKKIADLPVNCKYCGLTIRQSRNLRRHIETTHSKPKLKANYRKMVDKVEKVTDRQNSITFNCTDQNNDSVANQSAASSNKNTHISQKGNLISSNANVMTISASRVVAFPSLSLIPSTQNGYNPASNEVSCLSLVPNNQSFSFISNNPSMSLLSNNQPVSVIPNNSASLSISGSAMSVGNSVRLSNVTETVNVLPMQKTNICIPLNKLAMSDTQFVPTYSCVNNCKTNI